MLKRKRNETVAPRITSFFTRTTKPTIESLSCGSSCSPPPSTAPSKATTSPSPTTEAPDATTQTTQTTQATQPAPASTSTTTTLSSPPPSSLSCQTKAPPRTSRTVQTILNLGQKNAGRRTCPDCGMRFARSAHDDDVIHAKFHASVIGGIDYNGYANDVVVHDLLSEKIILITMATASPAQKKKCLEILDVVNQELGAVPISPESLARCKLFLYIAKSKVIGCVLAETIESGFRLSAGDIDGVDENEDLISCDSSNSEPAVCGISRVWVSKKHRRNGIAIKLLDACRRRFLFGCTLDKEAMAFSQPTVEGRKLATQYFGKSDFLIYTIGA